MPRSIWSGAISFGLVNVPVKLYSAVSRKSVRFHQLHDADNVRIQQKRTCPADGEEVSYEHIVKGFEISPDRYVVITQEELDSLDPKANRMIEIEDFVDLSEIDPVYYDNSYYLAPGTGAAKAYELLRSAMEESGKVAIARFVMRQKQYLGAIRANGPILTLSTMVFADEVNDPDRLDEVQAAEEVDATARETKMAQQLIESLAGPFEPEKYHDEYRERVLEMIEKKAAGEEIAVQPAAEEPEATPDLMAALEASIAAVKQRQDTDEKPAAKKPRKAAPASNGSGDGSAPAKKPRSRSRAKSKS